LIIRLSALGDVIHTIPVAAAIKEMAPDSQVSWVVQPAAASLLQNNPAVDRVLKFPDKKTLAQALTINPKKPAIDELSAFLKELRSEKYDVAIDAQGLFKSAILTYLSGAKVRIGFRNTREFADFFLTHAVDVGDYFDIKKSVVDMNMRLAAKVQEVLGLAQLGDLHHPRFTLPEPPAEATTNVRKWLTALAHINSSTSAEPNGAKGEKGNGLALEGTAPPVPSIPPPAAVPDLPSVPKVKAEVPGRSSTNIYIDIASDISAGKKKKLAVLMPGTTWTSKIWPPEYWCQLATRLATEHHYDIILVGGPAEFDTALEVEESLIKRGLHGVLNLTSRTSLLDLVALLPQADLVIGGDTGPLHIAAAAQAPHVVGIFGSTPRIRNGPYGQNATAIGLNLDCQPCFKKVCPLGTRACLIDFTPDEVLRQVMEFVNR
jgi:ADP-heptose:LPS heptosyltransferase